MTTRRNNGTGGRGPSRRNGSAGEGGQARTNGGGRTGVEAAVGAIAKSDVADLFAFWAGSGGESMPRSDKAARERVLEWMRDSETVEGRVQGLGKRLGSVFEAIVRSPRQECSYTELIGRGELDYLSSYDMEACLTALQRKGLVVQSEDARFAELGNRVFAIPAEVADGLLRQRRLRGRGIFEVITLRGHLDRLYADPERAARSSPQKLRQMYKMYVGESAAVARIERLPDGIRDLVQKAILEFGGILPRGLFERMDTELPHWNGRRWKLILEQSLIGTIAPLELSRFGIRHKDETLVVFNEVALAWLRRVAVPGDPDRPEEELSLGIDLVTNLSRFLTFLGEHDVRFTVRGEIFKTTEKKILQHLIPNPGRELSREEVLAFIYRFAKNADLLERTGERTLAVASKGREWEAKSLAVKLNEIHEFALLEKGLGGEYFHQVRLRRIFMRLLKRVEAGIWYDLMYLPFLARNTYLASLEEMQVEDYFEERSRASHYQPMEDPQRMAWNVVRWVRQRLYLLGIVDLGYDSSRRPVAMRLTRSGARLLGIHGDEEPIQEGVGNLVVTPDFEVVLFPSGDDAELVYDLDRFCVREKQGGHMIHFRISDETVRRALAQGMPLSRVLETLQLNSRTPVPQNVAFSIRDWAARAGLMRLSSDHVLSADDPDVIKKVSADPGARGFVTDRLDDNRLQLDGGRTPKRLRSLLRELGFVVELEEA